MPKVEPINNSKGEFAGYIFDCPGCGSHHVYEIPRWQFNGDVDNPTFSPSLKATWNWGPEREAKCCHFFVRNGRIEYCGDCTHDMAGQTVEMAEVN